MSEDTPLIQVNDDEEEEKIDFKQMVWFHGKASTTAPINPRPNHVT